MPSDVNTPTPVPQGSATASAELPGISQLAKEAWVLLKDRFVTLIGINILPILLVGILITVGVGGIIASFALGSRGGDSALAGGIIAIPIAIILVLGLLYISGLVQAASVVAVSSAENPGVIESYKRAFPRGFGMWWAMLIVSVVVAVGFILIIIPGIIFATWYAFTAIVLMTESLSAGDAMKRSKALVKGRWWPVFSKIAAIIIIYIVIQWIISLIAGSSEKLGIALILNLILGIGFSLFIQVYLFRLYEHLKATR